MNRAFSESTVISAFAESICHRLTRGVIAQLQQMTDDSLTSGENSGLRNVWDEICVQVQFEESFFWDAYDDIVRSYVDTAIAKLQPYEREAIWLQTEEGFDWAWEDEDEREPYPVCYDHIVDYLTREHVYAAAGRWSNPRIRAYLARG